MRFFGNIEAKVDAKGRVFLPAVFRKVLQSSAADETLIVRTDLSERCLVLYPESSWNRRMDQLTAKVDEYDEDEKLVLRQWVAEAESVTLDGNGRFLISRRLLQQAAINQSVRFIGMDDTIEIWAAEKTEKPFLSQPDFASKLKDIMRKNP